MPRREFKDKPSEERWQINAKCIRLGLIRGPDRSDYYDMLWAAARVRSSKELDADGRRKVLDHLNALLGYPKGRQRSAPSKDTASMMRKVDRLLESMGKDRAYADSTARHMFQIDRVEWLPADKLHKLVAALQIHANRKNRDAS